MTTRDSASVTGSADPMNRDRRGGPYATDGELPIAAPALDETPARLGSILRRPRSGRRCLLLGIQIGGTFALIAWLARQIDFQPLIANLGSIRWSAVVLLLGLGIADRLLGAWKWYILLVAKDIRLSFSSVFRIQMIATFFGSFLPTAVGFDAVRIYLASNATRRIVDSVSASTVDRILTVLGTLATAAVAALATFQAGGIPLWKIVVPTLLLTLGFWLSAQEQWMRQLGHMASRVIGQPAAALAAKLYWSLQDFSTRRAAVIASAGVTAASLIVRVVFVYVAAATLAVHVSFSTLLLSLPLTWVALMLPISIGGLGLQETAYLVALTSVGVEPTSAVAISLLDQVLMRVVSLLGAGFWLIDSHSVSRAI